MPERRWVLDTHTLISRMLVPAGVAGRAVDHALALGLLLASDDTLGELARVLARPKFDRWESLAERQRFIQLLGGVARRITITHRVQACRDPSDDKFLQLALNGEAEAIVTGDQDLLVLNPFHGVRIVTPADFCRIV
ncbi:MAG: putative toxin-antitoxin system toxin component, PIN family [Burkholderiaceae bacterium]|nr:putative toxin-antitoxin system toxin component, PIN family [Burkholderiaceae bacterium]